MGITPGRVSQMAKPEAGILRGYVGPGGREMVDEDEVDRVKEGLGVKAGRSRDMKPIEPAQPITPPQPPPMQRSRVIAVPNKKVADLTEEDFNLFDVNGNLDMVACRAWGEFEKSRKLNIERLALEGEYVKASEVGPAFEKAMLTIRKGVLATPSRLRSIEPEMSQSQLDSLDRLLREALDKATTDATDAN